MGLLPGLILVAGSTASAVTVTVCPAGCQFSTIQAAIDFAKSGDTITVERGPD